MRKVLVGLAVVCVGFAVLRLAVVALVVATGLALLVSLFNRPRETLSFLGTLALVILANAHPLACVITLGVIGLAVVLAGALRKSRSASPVFPEPRSIFSENPPTPIPQSTTGET